MLVEVLVVFLRDFLGVEEAKTDKNGGIFSMPFEKICRLTWTAPLIYLIVLSAWEEDSLELESVLMYLNVCGVMACLVFV